MLLPQLYNCLDKADDIIKKELSDVGQYIGAVYIVQLVEKLATDKCKIAKANE